MRLVRFPKTARRFTFQPIFLTRRQAAPWKRLTAVATQRGWLSDEIIAPAQARFAELLARKAEQVRTKDV
jgi:hypothetical protein